MLQVQVMLCGPSTDVSPPGGGEPTFHGERSMVGDVTVCTPPYGGWVVISAVIWMMITVLVGMSKAAVVGGGFAFLVGTGLITIAVGTIIAQRAARSHAA